MQLYMQRSVAMMLIEETEIDKIESLLLPIGCHFTDDGKDVIRCMESKEVSACPGSGKTTLLMAKLCILTKSMPLKNNRGICVLSHTNVAVDEIKNKLGDSAKSLLTYPNFVGTIQSFIDRFVVFPYLTHFTTGSIEVVDNKKYAECLWRICNTNSKYSSLKYFVKNQISINKKYNTEVDYIESLYTNDKNALCSKGMSKVQAGCDKISAQQFRLLKLDILKRGIVRYEDTY